MAKVPLARNLVQQQPVTDAKFRAFDGGGAAIGEGVRDFGRSMGQAAEQWQQADDIYNQAAAKKLINMASDRTRDTLWTGDDAYYRKEGFDAVNARPQVDKFFVDLKEELGSQTKNVHQRQMFNDAFDRLHGQEAEGIARYELSQGKAEETRQSAARMNNFQNDAIRFASDPAKFAENLEGGKIELRNQASQHGWAPETLKAAETDFVSKTHSAIFDSKLTDDVDGAHSYLESHRGDMTWQDAASADKALARPLAERQGYVDADSIMGIAPTPSGPGAVGTTVSKDQHFTAIVAIEGGTARNGKFLTSPKGAIGPAQVMPATAPEAARLAGLPFNEVKYRTDPAYNLALGQAYYNKQLSDFGDPIMAAAAYNAGPGSASQGTGLRGAVAKAKAAGNPRDWAKYLPAETRDYIRKFGTLTNDPAVRQSPQRQDLNELLARADVVAERENWTFERREAAKEQIERRVSRDDKLIARQEDTADRAASDWVNQRGAGFTDISQMPRSIRDHLSPDDWRSYVGVAKSNQKPVAVKANGARSTDLELMRVNNPEAFANLPLGKFVNELTPAETQGFLIEQAKMKKGDPDAGVRSAAASTISTFGADAGLSGKEGAVKRVRVQKIMEGELNALTQGKRKPTEDELYKAFQSATRDVTFATTSIWGAGEKTKPRFELEAGDVPPDRRFKIVRDYQSVYGRAPTDDQVAEIYRNGKGRHW